MIAFLLGALPLLPAAPQPPAVETHYVDASLDLGAAPLSWRFVDVLGDGGLELVVATGGAERELRVHRFERGALQREPVQRVRVLPDVLAWSVADVRDEPGSELVFLTRSGAWSYSLRHPGYRDNVRRLASVELIYDMPDPRRLPYWPYRLPVERGEALLLPGRDALSVWTSASAETGSEGGGASAAEDFVRRASIPTRPIEVDPARLGGEGRHRGGGPRVAIVESTPFLPDGRDGGAGLLQDARAYAAPALLDVDGDGRLDLIFVEGDQVAWHRGGADGPSSEPTRVEDLPEPLQEREDGEVSFRLADLDGDGWRDFVAVVADEADGFENRVHRVVVYRSTPERFFGERPHQVLRFEAGELGVELADVDGDERIDLVLQKLELPSLVGAVTGIEFTFTLLVFPGEERGFARRAAVEVVQTFDEENAFELAANRDWTRDCSGDGMADLVEVDLQGHIAVRRLRAAKTRMRGARWELDEAPWKRFEVEGSIESLRVDDYNGDGVADIVSAGEERLIVLLSAGAGGAVIGALLLSCALAQDPFVSTRLTLPNAKEEQIAPAVGLLLRDLTGNGALDLVRVDASGLRIFALGPDGRYSEEALATLAWPEGRVGWELADLDGDGVDAVLRLESDRGVVEYQFAADGSIESRVALEAQAALPSGVSRVHMARDVDADGRLDLILPGAGAHRIFLAGEDGAWATPLEIAFELRSSLEMGAPERVDGRFGQQVRVPWFRIEDVDGDGLADLVSETEARVAFHLAGPELSSEPTWILDLEKLRAELPRRRGIDFDNLLSLLDQRVTWQVADLDGEAPNDLMVLIGSKLRVYRGGSRSGPVGTPSQVLKSSGNVLLTFLRQAQGSPLPELQILRAERISATRVIRSLLFASDLDFEVFTYRNDQGVLSRRPTRRNRITIEIPRLLDFMDDDDGSLMDELEAQFDLPARRLPRRLDAPAAGDDVVDLRDGELQIYAACAPASGFLERFEDTRQFEPGAFIEGFFLEDFDAREDGASRVLDFGDVESLDFAPSAVLRRATRGLEPVARQQLGIAEKDVQDVMVRDLNGDGAADVIVVTEVEDDWVVWFLVRADRD